MGMIHNLPAYNTGSTNSESLTVGVNGSGSSNADTDGYAFQIVGVYVHADSDFGASDTATCTVLPGVGTAEYDTVVQEQNLSDATDYAWIPDSPVKLGPKDDFKVTIGNAGTNAVGITIQWQTIYGEA